MAPQMVYWNEKDTYDLVYEIRSNKNWLESVLKNGYGMGMRRMGERKISGNFKRRGDKLHAHVMENLILSRQPENNYSALNVYIQAKTSLFVPFTHTQNV